MKNNDRLIIITPAKNERDNVARLVDAVANQSRIPDAWIFVNDDSTDDTVDSFLSSASRNDALRACNVEVINHNSIDNSYALGTKYSRVVKFGLDYVATVETKLGVNFDFIGVLDCDVFPEREYYEKILARFQQAPNLGIAAGGMQIELFGDEQQVTYSNSTHAAGGLRIWRRSCLDATGYSVTISQDAVSGARAIMMGWSVRSFKDIAVTMRKRGMVYGYDYYGKSAYARWVPYWYVLLGAAKLAVKGSTEDALKYLSGYNSAKNNKDTRIDDLLAKRYFRYRLLYRLLGK
ncbi:glycosyltransferase family 2 protein [Desulfurispirillum indicum]|uniref:glycosyltransferase n=1 Tax=Desulfurispirillum indicum TaxID=936456 RepID=UPI001CFB5F90|nr:glycosyltransferase family A protein [Desulfurispirillum indicum]UCZ56526.1 glycosyltransferase family 2 protein [Desulfurispirillum indicum]